VVVRGRKLVTQASNRLAREGVPHGIMMASHKLFKPYLPVQVCSIDTLHARSLYPPADLVVIDEVHQGTSEAYQTFASKYKDAFILGVTATPYNSKPLRHLADKIISPISMQDLITQNFLVPCRYFAPANVDLSSVKIDSKTKDYNQKDLGIAMDKLKLVGDIVNSWKKYGQNRPTVCFAVNVEHSKHIRDSFMNAGILASHCDADDNDEYRNFCINRLEKGDIKVLCNVGLFQIGVDIPILSCLILARPTRSLILHIQQCGRAMRTYPDKENAIILDHAGNLMRLGLPTEDHEPTIDGKIISKNISLKTCKNCFAVVEKMPCPECGYEVEKDELGPRMINHVDGELQEIGAPVIQKVNPLTIGSEIDHLKMRADSFGYKPGWVWHQIKTKYGSYVANFYLGKSFGSR